MIKKRQVQKWTNKLEEAIEEIRVNNINEGLELLEKIQDEMFDEVSS